MAVEYGTIGIRPRGEWDPDMKYDLLNLVVYDGSSYVAHTDPPKGTLPTDTAYWQVSAQGTGKATAGSVGTVKPDGATTEVSTDGSLSAKQATQTTSGIVKGSDGITVGEDGSLDVNTQFTQATELANIIAGEAIANVLGKVSKSIATTMNLDQNALLKNMLTNIDVNDSNKVPTSAFVHTLVERIDTVNSNLVTQKLPTDTDIDTIISDGYYSVDYTSGQFKGFNLLRVRHFDNNSRFSEQILTNLDNDDKIFKRYQLDGVWKDWVSTVLDSDLNKIIQEGVFDLSNPPLAHTFIATAGSSNMPNLGGNSCMVFQLFPGNTAYNAMFAFSFGSDRIAMNRRFQSGWKAWKYSTLT